MRRPCCSRTGKARACRSVLCLLCFYPMLPSPPPQHERQHTTKTQVELPRLSRVTHNSTWRLCLLPQKYSTHSFNFHLRCLLKHAHCLCRCCVLGSVRRQQSPCFAGGQGSYMGGILVRLRPLGPHVDVFSRGLVWGPGVRALSGSQGLGIPVIVMTSTR